MHPRPPDSLLAAHPGIGEWAFLHAYRGSVAHGMYEPNHLPDSIDDVDTMAFCVPPIETYFGLSEYGSRGTVEIKADPWDIVVYESRKALRLLAGGNPNVLSMLWLADDMYLRRTHAGDMLIENRHLFIGKHVYKPFAGYASQQLEKMTRGAFKGYMGEKRKALVAKHGYDTKNAAHLIRLLRMGTEFLRSGTLNVDRSGIDAAELLDIKHGEWTLEHVQAESQRLFAVARTACDESRLPDGPDRDAINRLAVAIARIEITPRPIDIPSFPTG